MKYLAHLPDADPDRLMDSGRFRLSTTRRELMAAFNRVIELSDRCQTTDLHVRRLLCYIRAQDKTYAGAARSIKRIAKKLVLSVSTCRRVIRRAVEHFGLLIVIPQIHALGGQTYNRYTINWDQVDALLVDEVRENILLEQAKRVTKDLAKLAKANCQSSSTPGNTDVPVGSAQPESSATPISRIDMPVRLGPLAAVSTGRTGLNSSSAPAQSDMPVRLALPVGSSSTTTICPSGSDLPPCPHTSLPNAMCTSCRDRELASGIKRDLGWIFKDFQADVTIYHDQPPLPPQLHKVFARLARTPRPSAADLTPRGQTPPFPIVLPEGLPAELLAHFDVLMAKAQTAIDCAAHLCPKRRRPSRRKGRRASRLAPPTKFERLMSRLKYRLFSLLCKIEVTQWRASNPAMCRTYLPPINPEPLPDFAAILKEMASTPLRPDFSAMPSLTPDFSQFEPLKYDFSGCSIDAAKFFNEAADLSDHPAASIDHPPLEPLRSSSSSAVESATPTLDSLESKIEYLLRVIEELLAAIKAALRCARALRISWLKKRLISWQRKTKTICARVQRASQELTAIPSPQ